MKILFRIYLVRQKSNTVATTAITHKCNEHGTAISVNYRVQDVNKYRRNELKFGSKYLEQTLLDVRWNKRNPVQIYLLQLLWNLRINLIRKGNKSEFPFNNGKDIKLTELGGLVFMKIIKEENSVVKYVYNYFVYTKMFVYFSVYIPRSK